MSMAALSFRPTPTAPPLFNHRLHHDYKDVSFLQDLHPDVGDALLGFVYDPLDPAVNAGLDAFLNIPLLSDDPADDDDDKQPCAKKPRVGGPEEDSWFDFAAADGTLGARHVPPPPALTEFPTADFLLPLPQPYPPFARGSDAKTARPGNNGSSQSAAARERRRRISEKTAELSRLIPGGHRLNTAEMLQEAARHVKLLQAQVGMLALLRNLQAEEKVPAAMAQEKMHDLLIHGGVQERLAAEGKCLVPRALVDTLANDTAVRSDALVRRDLARFMDSLPAEQ
ncbi:hypothetical protein QYE76_004919 [Lolium multiflorum]|uniref:BHLH domain-containing protein n=1 Tax=Lolium multiflorum TaxID=4521 RepID=A0AAD8W1U5_LOLMU|nr:hypothetical protein QYE76_004919 [Lolium multiflorum]